MAISSAFLFPLLNYSLKALPFSQNSLRSQAWRDLTEKPGLCRDLYSSLEDFLELPWNRLYRGYEIKVQQDESAHWWLERDLASEADLQSRNRIYLFNIIIACEWEPSALDRALFYRAFRRANDYLYDVTNGYMGFGQLAIGGREWMPIADVHIFASSRTYPASSIHYDLLAPYRVHRRRPIRLGRVLWDRFNKRYYSWDEPEGYRVIVHEWAHYALGWKDAYLHSTQSEDHKLILPVINPQPGTIMDTTTGISEGEFEQERVQATFAKAFPGISFSHDAGPTRMPLTTPLTQTLLYEGDAEALSVLTSTEVNSSELRTFNPNNLRDYVISGPLTRPIRIIAQGSPEIVSDTSQLGSYPQSTSRLLGYNPGDILFTMSFVPGSTPEGSISIRMQQTEHLVESYSNIPLFPSIARISPLDPRFREFPLFIKDIKWLPNPENKRKSLEGSRSGQKSTDPTGISQPIASTPRRQPIERPNTFSHFAEMPLIGVIPLAQTAEANYKLEVQRIHNSELTNRLFLYPSTPRVNPVSGSEGIAITNNPVISPSPDGLLWLAPLRDNELPVIYPFVSSYSGEGPGHDGDGPPPNNGGSDDGQVRIYFGRSRKEGEHVDNRNYRIIVTQIPDYYGHLTFAVAANEPLPQGVLATLVVHCETATSQPPAGPELYRYDKSRAGWSKVKEPPYISSEKTFLALPLQAQPAWTEAESTVCEFYQVRQARFVTPDEMKAWIINISDNRWQNIRLGETPLSDVRAIVERFAFVETAEELIGTPTQERGIMVRCRCNAYLIKNLQLNITGDPTKESVRRIEFVDMPQIELQEIIVKYGPPDKFWYINIPQSTQKKLQLFFRTPAEEVRLIADKVLESTDMNMKVEEFMLSPFTYSLQCYDDTSKEAAEWVEYKTVDDYIKEVDRRREKIEKP